MKTLNQIVKGNQNGYYPKAGDEQKFVDKHVIAKVKNLGGKATEDDDLFNAANIKTVKREKEDHGYDPDKSDQEVYEAAVTQKDVKMAIGVSKDKRYVGGNMTGATKTIEKMKKGLSSHPAVQKALRKANEEVEQIDEMDKSQTPPGRDGGYQFAPGPKVSKKDIEAVKKNPTKHLSDLFAKEYAKKKVKEETEQIDEKLTASDPTSKWIHDFVHSKNKKFAGKSREERIKMALGAKYAKEDVNIDLTESKEAKGLYHQHVADIHSLLKKIGEGVKQHKMAIENDPTRSKDNSYHYGHVGDMKHLKRSLEDLHQQLTLSGEYAKPPMVARMQEEKDIQGGRQLKTLRQILEGSGASVTLHVKPHPDKKGHHVVVKSSDSERFKVGESIPSHELEQGQDEGYLKVKHMKG